jgi:hypothetical protein
VLARRQEEQLAQRWVSVIVVAEKRPMVERGAVQQKVARRDTTELRVAGQSADAART